MDFSSDTIKILVGIFSFIGTFFGFYLKIQANTRQKEKHWNEKDQAHDVALKLIKKDIVTINKEINRELQTIKEDAEKSHREQEKFDARILKTIERQTDKIDGILTNAIDSLKS